MIRTLSVLAIAVLCCWHSAVNANELSREQGVAEVERLGGNVEFDESQKDKPIVKVDLHATKVTDGDLVILKDLKELRALDLRLTHVGDAVWST